MVNQEREEEFSDNVQEQQRITSVIIPDFQYKFLSKQINSNINLNLSDSFQKQKLQIEDESEQKSQIKIDNCQASCDAKKSQLGKSKHFINLPKSDKIDTNLQNESHLSQLTDTKILNTQKKEIQSQRQQMLQSKQSQFQKSSFKDEQKNQFQEQEAAEDIQEQHNTQSLYLPDFQSKILQKRQNSNFYQDKSIQIQKKRIYTDDENEQKNKNDLSYISLNSLQTQQTRLNNNTNMQKLDKSNINLEIEPQLTQQIETQNSNLKKNNNFQERPSLITNKQTQFIKGNNKYELNKQNYQKNRETLNQAITQKVNLMKSHPMKQAIQNIVFRFNQEILQNCNLITKSDNQIQIQNQQEQVPVDIEEKNNNDNYTIPNFQFKYLKNKEISNLNCNKSQSMSKNKFFLEQDREQKDQFKINNNSHFSISPQNQQVKLKNFANSFNFDKIDTVTQNESFTIQQIDNSRTSTMQKKESNKTQPKNNVKYEYKVQENQRNLNLSEHNNLISKNQMLLQIQNQQEAEIVDEIQSQQDRTNLLLPNFQSQFLQKQSNSKLHFENQNSFQNYKSNLEDENDYKNEIKLNSSPTSINSIFNYKLKSKNLILAQKFDKFDLISQNDSIITKSIESKTKIQQRNQSFSKKSFSKQHDLPKSNFKVELKNQEKKINKSFENAIAQKLQIQKNNGMKKYIQSTLFKFKCFKFSEYLKSKGVEKKHMDKMRQEVQRNLNIDELYKDLIFLKKAVSMLLSVDQMAAIKLVGLTDNFINLDLQSENSKIRYDQDKKKLNHFERQYSIYQSEDLQIDQIEKFLIKCQENQDLDEVDKRIFSSITKIKNQMNYF
ncbi:hypothetical protein ABPG73_004615 [Tetrahymena malaccensis]